MIKPILTFIFAWFSTIASVGAQEIGENYGGSKTLNYAQHKSLHFLSGFVVGSVEAALKKEKNILQSGLISGESAAVAEIIAEGIVTDSMTYFNDAKKKQGDKFDAQKTQQDWLKHSQNCKSIAQLGTATLALTLNADVNKAISSAQNATENNFIGCAITAGFIAYEIYDLYDTCKNESAGAALKKVAVSGVLAVCGVTQQIGKS